MPQNPLSIIQANDPELFDEIGRIRKLALSDGALDRKAKLLIALALDASAGAADGVRSLATQALAAGATKAEIMETLRVVEFIDGVGPIYTAARGLDGVFGED